MKRMACVLALTTGAALSAGVAATPASAETVVTPAGSGLALSLSAAGTVPTDAPLTLDVRFEGGKLRIVELFVDGVVIKKKNLATRSVRGHLEFQMEAGLLSEGTHEILVKAQDGDGNTATATTQIKVTPGASGLVRFQFPKNKAMVQGVVPIEVKIDSSIRSPYVTFLIDNNFLALTNYAPFMVNWDSLKVTNGPHTVEVEVYDGETLAKVKVTSLQINVNNPGGLTSRQKDTPDLSKTGKTGPAQETITKINDATDPGRYSAAPATGVNPDETVARLITPQSNKSLLLQNGPRSNARLVLPSMNDHSSATASSAFANRDHNAADRQSVHVTKPGLMGLAAEPNALAANVPAPTHNRVAHSTFRPRRAGNMAARPSLTMETETQNVIGAQPMGAPATMKFSPLMPAIKPVTKVTPIQIVRANGVIGPGAISGKGRSFQVAFDNTRIAFDVQPRVQKGLPLAPFRQIFEHTGGTIQWFNQSKVLRAFNSTREIEFKVGNDEAKVNNQTVKMEAKTYIEKGRTIVPLSFVRDALDVNVTYDAATGHLRIESKK